MGVCNCSMFCCTLLYVHFSIAIILMGKRELIALLNLSSWCLVMVERLFLAVSRGSLQFVIVVFPDHTHLLFLLWVESVLASILSEGSIFASGCFVFVLCSSIVESIGVWGCVSDCTLGWGTGGGVGLSFLERKVVLSFLGGEAFSPSIHCIPIRRH